MATTWERVTSFRESVRAAAAGEQVLLHLDLADTDASVASTARLATLAAFALSYARGAPVGTVVTVADRAAGEPGPAAAERARLVDPVGARAADAAIGDVDRWLPRLGLPARQDPAETAFLLRLVRAWGFAAAFGGRTTAVAGVIGSRRFAAWPAKLAADPAFHRIDPATGLRHGLFSPGVIDRPGDPCPPGLRNPVVLAVTGETRPDDLAARFAALDPAGEPGALVVLLGATAADRLPALLAATAAHHPAWVIADDPVSQTAPRLRRVDAALRAAGAHLAGVSLGGEGGRLTTAVRLATALSALPPDQLGAASPTPAPITSPTRTPSRRDPERTGQVR